MSSLQNPKNLSQHYSRDETRFLPRQALHQCAGALTLFRLILEQEPKQDVRIDPDHLPWSARYRLYSALILSSSSASERPTASFISSIVNAGRSDFKNPLRSIIEPFLGSMKYLPVSALVNS